MAIRTYKVTLDTKNAIAPEPVFLRQGDKTGAVVIDATLMDNGSPVSLTGLTPSFMANTADGKAFVSDTTGFSIVDASGGEFTYQVPSQLGSVDGKIKIAYFSLSDSSGAQSTFNVVFVVERAADMTQESAKDWMSNLNNIISQYNQWVNNAHSSWQDFVNANKEIIESIDPGGTLLNEVIDARKPANENPYKTLGLRLDDMNEQTARALDNQVFNKLDLKRTARYVNDQYLQGNCYTGNGKWLRATNMGSITTLIETDADGNVIRTKEINLGHANWIDYDKAKGILYVSELNRLNTETGVASTNCIVDVLDYATLSLVNTIDLTNLINDSSSGIMSYSHDPVTGEVYICTESNQKSLKAYLYNDNKLTEIPIPALGYEDVTSNQGICAYDGYLYYVKYEPSAIFKFDNKGKLYGVYNVDYFAQSQSFLGEVEQISPKFDGERGEFTLGAVRRLNSYDPRFVHQSFDVNFSTGMPVFGKLTSGMPLKETKYIEVDANTKVVNGDGTSANPFSDISEALELTNNVMYQNVVINVHAGTYPIITFYNPSAFVTIKGVEDNVNIGGIRGRGINIRLENVSIKITNDVQTEDIRIESSTIYLDTVKCLTTNGNNIYSESSKIRINNCAFSAPVPLSLNKLSTLTCNPFFVPAFSLNGFNSIIPSRYQITTSVTSIKRVNVPVNLTQSEITLLKSSTYVIAQLLYQGNTYWLKGALIDGLVVAVGVVGGALNSITAQGSLSMAEIQINVDANAGKAWIDHVSRTNIFIETATGKITGEAGNLGVQTDLTDISIVRLWGGY